MASVSRRPAVLIAALVAVLALSGCGLFGSDAKPEPAAQAFLDAWGRNDLSAAAAATDNADAARGVLDSFGKAVGSKPSLTLGTVEKTGDTNAVARYTANWVIDGVDQPWKYEAQLALVQVDDKWTVHWQPADLHPKLGDPALTADGTKFRVQRTLPERAAIQDASGQPLFTATAVVTVGVEPGKVTNLNQLAATLASVLKISAADIVADVSKAKPTDFVEVITLRREAYLQVRPQIYNLPGTVFRSSTQQLGPSAQFAQPLLGRIGAATAEVVKESNGKYASGDQVGVSGLQRALNDKLTGSAGATIDVVTTKNVAVGTLGTIKGTAGTPVKITLDRKVQAAADSAVAGQGTPAAIVAIKPSTGEILAVSNNDAAPYNIAFTGRYPAGSTFKIITATALMTARVTQPTATVACPGTTVVGGREFENQDQFDLGNVPFKTAFAKSCNTTFTALSQKLNDSALPQAAASYGVGSAWTLPVDSFGGSVPAPKDGTEKAADAIGQGRVEVSPLSMALVAADVQAGKAVIPSLLAGTAATPTGTAPTGPPAAVLPALRDMMRTVVTAGTATALASAPGGPVAGKTGTAEYGTETPPRSHAWFTGYRGDLAFAVFVQDGQSSGKTAVPVASTFLNRLGA